MLQLQIHTAPLSEVAVAIGRSETWLRRNWIKLHDEEGFPRKLSTGWVWPRAAVERWLRAGGRLPVEHVPANNNGTEPVDIVEAMRQANHARYGIGQ